MCRARYLQDLLSDFLALASLHYSTTAGVTLNRQFPGHPNCAKEHTRHISHKQAVDYGKHVIISSEPTTFDEDEWKLIPRDTLVLVDDQDKMRAHSVMYDDNLNNEDPDT